jgi:hypothetical protein
MTTFKFFSAALILSAAVATPVAAQQAIQEPGNYAFYHPNGDVLNAGSTRPADAMASQLSGMQMSVKKPHKAIAVRAPAKRY